MRIFMGRAVRPTQGAARWGWGGGRWGWVGYKWVGGGGCITVIKHGETTCPAPVTVAVHFHKITLHTPYIIIIVIKIIKPQLGKGNHYLWDWQLVCNCLPRNKM